MKLIRSWTCSCASCCCYDISYPVDCRTNRRWCNIHDLSRIRKARPSLSVHWKNVRFYTTWTLSLASSRSSAAVLRIAPNLCAGNSVVRCHHIRTSPTLVESPIEYNIVLTRARLYVVRAFARDMWARQIIHGARGLSTTSCLAGDIFTTNSTYNHHEITIPVIFYDHH